jgi:hypothetical protein
MRSAARTWLLPTTLATLLAAGCGPRPAAAPAAPAPDRRAALALVVVDNRTTQHLAIVFHPPGAPEAEVLVGRVPPGTQQPMAPIPAGEPIVLSARTAAGHVLSLPARSFRLDDEWRWVIDAGASFLPPAALRDRRDGGQP